MEKRTLTATTEDAGTRLDSLLAGRLAGVTRSAAARLIESGCVTVDGKPVGGKAPELLNKIQDAYIEKIKNETSK